MTSRSAAVKASIALSAARSIAAGALPSQGIRRRTMTASQAGL
jgi:hypothetical protein